MRSRSSLSTEWIATLDGFVNAQIRPQVSGYLVSREYQEGSFVQKGQVLFEIDPRPFEVALSQAGRATWADWDHGGAGARPALGTCVGARVAAHARLG